VHTVIVVGTGLSKRSDLFVFEQVIHQGCVQLHSHVREAELFFRQSSRPVEIGVGNNTMQQAQRIDIHFHAGCGLML
ncbi:MAG: hypothetical protein VKJ63_03345, partial [Synechococcus sp.]|nr:hypothetical protein [Synechococcus sp.]